jgi:NAD(P)-dependent dehydrogenase (short-subunit alcohol dehydrogenase family)
VPDSGLEIRWLKRALANLDAEAAFIACDHPAAAARVVGPADIAALAVHLMTNTAVTGATYDIDGGQQLVEA